jgi:SAM-dependent methyltransferase
MVGAELNYGKFAPHITPADVVVDFGCGGGYLLARLPGRIKIGVEVNDVGRASVEALGLKAVASTDALSSGSVDIVISNHALEHTLQPYAELCGIRRIMREGGKLVVYLPVDDWRTQRHAGEDQNHHLYTWTPLLLANLLGEAGFAVQKCAVVNHAWLPWYVTLSRRLPRVLYGAVATATSVCLKRRQVMAVASPA